MKHIVRYLLIATLCHSAFRIIANIEYSSHDTVSCNELPKEPLDEQNLAKLFELGTQTLRMGEINRAIEYFQKATHCNQESPQVYFNLGLAYETNDDIDKAIEAYQSAIALKLDYPKAHVQLAQLLQRKGHTDQAISHYQHAVALDTHLTGPANTLAHLLCDRERITESLPYFEHALNAQPNNFALTFEYANKLVICGYNKKALELYYTLLTRQPQNSTLLYNIAYTLKGLGRIPDALIYYHAALELNLHHEEAHFGLGLACLTMGDFTHGWPEYEWRWQRNSQLKPRSFSKPQWDGNTSLDEKTIFIHAEQGLGDTFQFIRYAQELKNRYRCIIICAVQGPLHTIISRSCPYIDYVIRLGQVPTHFDVHIPLLSLPCALKTSLDSIPHSIPYLFPDKRLVESWRNRLAGDSNFKVGICWQGNDKYSSPSLRATVATKSLPLALLQPLSDIPGITLYSLQKETGTEQLNAGGSRFTVTTFGNDFDQKRGRFMDTAAVIKNLDLVITVDTSIAHLAGALGTPVWIMLPKPADWRWMLNRSDSPWYLQTMRLFRQSKPGNWPFVIETIAHELKKIVCNTSQDTERSSIPVGTNSNPQDVDEFSRIITAQKKRVNEARDTKQLAREIRIAYHLLKAHNLLRIA